MEFHFIYSTFVVYYGGNVYKKSHYKVTKLYNTMKNKYLLLLLSLLGFAGCENSQNYACMYDTPNSDFEIKGKVIDTDGDPIKAISVEASGNTTTTDSNGDFSIDFNTVYVYKVSISDIDGQENGGEFESVELIADDYSEYKDGKIVVDFGEVTLSEKE